VFVLPQRAVIPKAANIVVVTNAVAKRPCMSEAMLPGYPARTYRASAFDRLPVIPLAESRFSLCELVPGATEVQSAQKGASYMLLLPVPPFSSVTP
jgi:hypothetical protein